VKKMTAASAIAAGLKSVTKDWAKQRRAEERHASAIENRRARLIRASDYYNFRSAAFEVMGKAYLAASANGTLPASARQVMYQARPFIQEKMGGQQLNDQYFCQQLLPDYINFRGVNWDITYDDRGHFTEPHTGRTIGLGTIAVREYVESIGPLKLKEAGFAPASVETSGPDGCYGSVFFIEKEGFLPLFEAVALERRYDIAIKSTKGMSVTAARQMVDSLSACGLTVYVLHDFDKAGFSIVGTLRGNTRRYSYDNKTKIIDLGLRLSDVQELGLEDSAEGAFDRGSPQARLKNLRANGATQDEADFLLDRRVELNALTSDQLIAFIERKLDAHGVKKVVPTEERLAEAYKLFVRSTRLEEAVKKLVEEQSDQTVDVPTDLEEQVAQYLKEHPTARWDDAVKELAQGKDDNEVQADG